MNTVVMMVIILYTLVFAQIRQEIRGGAARLTPSADP